jgi:hypothetical protein
MKRTMIFVGIVSAVTLLGAGCGNGVENGTAGTQRPEAGPTPKLLSTPGFYYYDGYYAEGRDPLPPYNAAITWRGVANSEERDDIEYFFDGVSMGNGKPGFRKLLDRLRRLSDESTIVIYPFTSIPQHRTECFAPTVNPFSADSYQRLRMLVDEKKLRAILYSGLLD